MPKITFDQKKLFLLKFSVLTLSFFLFFFLFKDSFEFLLTSTASVLSFFLSLLQIPNFTQGTLIHFQNITFEIIYECTALFPMFMLIAAILSYPSSRKNRLFGILTGLPIVYIANMARLIILSIVGINYFSAFKFVHSFLWEAIFLILVIFFFLIWINFQGDKPAKK